MNALDALRKMLTALTPEELKVAGDFLTVFNTRGAGNKTLYHQLFDLLCREIKSKELFTEAQLEELIYAKTSGTGFPRLVLRLRDKIQESLTLSINTDRPEAYSEKSKALYAIRKDLSIAQIIIARGLEEQAGILLDECIKTGVRYEHFEECATALRIRMQLTAINSNPKRADELSSKYDLVVRSMLAVKKAERYYMQLISNVEYKLSDESMELLQVQINELQRELNTTRSANVAYYQTYLEIHYCQQLRLYKKASEILQRQVELVEEHPALFNPSRLSLSLLNQAWNELYLHHFAQALRYTKKAAALIPYDNFNYSQILLANFYACFYSSEYEKSLSLLNELDAKDGGLSGEYRAGKRAYLRASVLFMLKRYKEVNQVLAESNPIDKDKEGWNLLIRILSIMNDIEANQIENAFRAVEALRKQIDKFKKGNINSVRMTNIYEVLRGLSNSRFEFAEARKKKQEEFTALTKQPASLWSIFSCELVVFEQWFIAKLTKSELNLKPPIYSQPIRETAPPT